MNINYKQPQFELFPANSATLEDINKPRFLLANLTLSIESLVIFAIFIIMVGLFAFSLGVEQGKHIAAQALDERVSAAWNVRARTLAPAVAPAAVAPAAIHRPAAARVAPKIAPAPVVHFIFGTRYTLQGATYGNEEYAKQDALKLRQKGFPSFLIKNGKYWLLCIGQFSSKEGALAFLRKLPGDYRGAKLRRF